MKRGKNFEAPLAGPCIEKVGRLSAWSLFPSFPLRELGRGVESKHQPALYLQMAGVPYSSKDPGHRGPMSCSPEGAGAVNWEPPHPEQVIPGLFA